MLDDFKQPGRRPVVSDRFRTPPRRLETPYSPKPIIMVRPDGRLSLSPTAKATASIAQTAPSATTIGVSNMPHMPVVDPPTEKPILLLEDGHDHYATDPPDDSRRGKRWMFWKSWHRPNRKQAIIIATVLILMGGGAAYAATRPQAQPVAQKAPAKQAPVPPPPPILSPLTGMVVTPEQQVQPVTGVMIENSPDARPQSGLRDAGVVYEAIAEGGITRFLSLYQESAPGHVGPIRSARPYYLDWAMPFDATLAHVGGSPDALSLIKSLGVKDLDQFANAGAYRRITERYAPHNVYTGVNTLSDLGKSKGWTTSTFTGFTRKAESAYKAPAAPPAGSTTKPADTRVVANSIGLGISSAFYNVAYNYDPATNSYLRNQGGAAHIDAETKAQLAPKVVIALVMSYGLMADGKHSAYGTTGSGPMYVFQDGTVTEGTWTKPDVKTQFTFSDTGGAPLKLNPGQTWLSVVDATSDVTYE